jgi:uncharacterized RDD family membrane protein YckC
MNQEEIASHFHEIEKELGKPEFRLAPKNIRFINLIVDSIVGIIIFFVATAGLNVICDIWSIDLRGMIDSMGASLYFNLVYLLTQIVYYTASEFLTGKTFGKVLTRTHVVRKTGDPLDLRTALIRSLCRFIPLDSFSYLDDLVGWHDSLSKTHVVKDE